MEFNITPRGGRAANTHLWALASRDSSQHLRMSALVLGFVEVVLSSSFAHWIVQRVFDGRKLLVVYCDKYFL